MIVVMSADSTPIDVAAVENNIVTDPSRGTGARYFVAPMAMGAATAAAHSLLVEVHSALDTDKSDGPQSLTPKSFSTLMASAS